jgi:hypothetical protein
MIDSRVRLRGRRYVRVISSRVLVKEGGGEDSNGKAQHSYSD